MVTAVQSLAGILGRIGHVALDWKLIGPLALWTMLGCVGGTSAAQRLSPTALRRVFAWFVFGVALFVLGRLAVVGDPRSAGDRGKLALTASDVLTDIVKSNRHHLSHPRGGP